MKRIYYGGEAEEREGYWKEVSIWGEYTLVCPFCDAHIKQTDVFGRPTKDYYKAHRKCPKCGARMHRHGYIY